MRVDEGLGLRNGPVWDEASHLYSFEISARPPKACYQAGLVERSVQIMTGACRRIYVAVRVRVSARVRARVRVRMRVRSGVRVRVVICDCVV